MQKRRISILIPYYKENDEVYVFLQKRSEKAERLPGYFGFFGGGAENDEFPQDTLTREVREELGISADGAKFFSLYEFYGSIKNIYIMEVDKDFGDKIVLGEGDYGKFFSENDIFSEDKIIEEDKLVLRNLFGKIKKNNPFV